MNTSDSIALVAYENRDYVLLFCSKAHCATFALADKTTTAANMGRWCDMEGALDISCAAQIQLTWHANMAYHLRLETILD